MKVNKLVNSILDNWPAKVICFVMALGFYILYQVSSLETKTFVVPLHVLAENGVVPASPYPSEVKVSVRCKADDVALLRESDFYAYLDANYAVDDGSYDFHVFTRLSGNALSVNPLEIHLVPEVVKLTVEQQLSAYVPVSPLISGTPAYGYEVQSASVSPSQVKMTGPHSMVEKYRRLQTKGVSIEGLSASKTIETQLDNGSSLVKIDDSQTVSLQVTIVPVMIDRTFEKLPVNLINVSPQLEARLSVDALSLSLHGPQTQLEKYSPSGYVFFANCASVTESGVFEVPLSVMVPENFTVSASLPKKIGVRFTEKSAGQEEGSAPAPVPAPAADGALATEAPGESQ